MVPGDCGESASRLIANLYKSYLNSDIQSVVHHGSTGATAMLNTYIDAEVVLWHTTDANYEAKKNVSYNVPLLNAEYTYIADSRVTVIALPFEGEASVTTYPASQPTLQP